VSRLQKTLAPYLTHHRNSKNKATHWVGIPLVVLSLFIALGWIPISGSVTAATLLLVGSLLYYLSLNWICTVFIAAATMPLYWLSQWICQQPAAVSVTYFLVTFVVGWFLQIMGHWFEGRRPAFLDNLLQLMSGPLFLAYEFGVSIGVLSEILPSEAS
jgi:uncharacterized membrane protein YGL010W